MSDVAKHKPADLAVKKSKRDAGSEIDAFVQRSRALKAAAAQQQGRGRLIFALDATHSRQPTWDMACQLQAEMFREVSSLDIQLVFYRGLSECRSSGWVSSSERLANLMSGITCRAGTTQIGRILAHARRETEKTKVAALAFVGDAMEEELDELAAAAGELGKLGVKAFVFQEGDDPEVESAFREIARLTHGAYCRFDAGAPHQLAELLRAVAAYAAGGVEALEARPSVAGWLSFFARP
jgi:hypothetical protein